MLAHFRKEHGWEKVQSLFEDGDAEIVMASVSVAEFGRRLLDLGAAESEVIQILSDYRVLMSEIVPVDSNIAHGAFVLGSRTPARLPMIDALIAAAAQMRHAVLVHRDQHMAAIPRELLQQLQL